MKVPEAIVPLILALSDPEPRVRRAAANALWNSSEIGQPAIPARAKAYREMYAGKPKALDLIARAAKK